jgi:hypothetical protein
MPRKCANCEQIDVDKRLDFDRLSPIPSDTQTGLPRGVADRLISVSNLSRRSAGDEIGTQGRATVDGVVVRLVGVVPEPGLTLSSGVRFWSNGRMTVLVFGEVTIDFNAWM